MPKNSTLTGDSRMVYCRKYRISQDIKLRKVNTIMKIKTCIVIIVSLLSFQFVLSQTPKPIGTNLNELTYYSTELVFTDNFKQSAPWISSNADGSGDWDTKISIPLNSKGYPIEIPYNDGVHSPQKIKTLVAALGDNTIRGVYRLKVSGNGKIQLSGGASGIYTCPVDTLVNVKADVILNIIQSIKSDPINDIKFILPKYVNNYNTNIYTTEFLDFIADFQMLRFMDWTKTNGSDVVSWSERSAYPYYTQHQKTGVAWEEVVALANHTKKDIWINIPHKADDSYITNLATLLKSTLTSQSKIYLEYSNEVWNGAFVQHHECAEMGKNLGYTGQEWERAWKVTAKRSADIFRIFENVFGSDSQFVKVIPSQAGADGWLSNQLVTYFKDTVYNPTGVKANAIAIAPYFGGGIADQIVTEKLVSTITTSEILQRMQSSLVEADARMDGCKKVAISHGLDLICYEGGQHLTATGNNVNNTELTAKLIAVNHDPGMESLYCQYFDNWYKNYGSMFCHFTSHGMYSKWGSWGVKESMFDTLSPKYLALQHCVFTTSSVSVAENETAVSSITIHPNPTSGSITFSVQANVRLTNAAGLVLAEKKNTTTIDLSNQPVGVYFLTLTDNNGQVLRHSKIIKEN